MNVAVLDPSDFTPPYDKCLSEALGIQTEGNTLHLIGAGRGQKPKGYAYVSLFYRLSEELRSKKIPESVYLAVKGVEHMIDMCRLWRFLATLQPDVIHFQWLPVPLVDRWFLSIFRKIAPVVLTVHDTQPFNDNPPSRLQMLGWEQVLKSVDALIVHTRFSANVLKEAGVERERIHVIPHGLLDENGLEHIGSGNEKKRNGGKTIIQFFGTLKPYKGLDILIEAFSRVQKEEEVVLKISGRPRMNVKPLKKKANKLGIREKINWDLRFVPEEEVPNIFREADVLVLPYRTIDASGVLTKALLFGTPVIASDIGGIDEFVTDGGEGFLVPSEDPEALASALRELIRDEDLRARMGEQAQKRAGQIPSWKDIAKETKNIYKKLRK